MAHQFQLIFAATLAQFNTAMGTTLPAVGITPLQAPNKFQGLIQSGTFTFTANTSTSVNLAAVSSLLGLYPGLPVSGAGIPVGDTIATVGATNTATLAAATTTTANAMVITATPNVGQIDFSYDGANYLCFFGANTAPVVQQPNAGVVENNMSANLVAFLTAVFAATLGTPIQPNLAVPPPFVS